MDNSIKESGPIWKDMFRILCGLTRHDCRYLPAPSIKQQTMNIVVLEYLNHFGRLLQSLIQRTNATCLFMHI
jgi:hypothetical protein